MANSVINAISIANKMIADGVVYGYGFKYEEITTSKVNMFASMYPSVYTASIKNKMLSKVGKIGIDCSGFVCKSFGVSYINSTALMNKMVNKYNTSDMSNLINGQIIWRKGHIGMIEIDDSGEAWVLEAKGTNYDLTRTKYASRGKSFTYYGELSGVDYTNAKKYESNTNKPVKPSNGKIRGIDVSSYQGNIDWKKVADDGIQFAILRGTIKNGTLDTTFERNYKGAKENGIDVSVYHFSYALDSNKAINDAINLVSKLNGKKLPIWLDLEYNNQGALGKAKVSEIAVAFVQACKNLGYECHIYSNLSWYKGYYDPAILASMGCKFWIARYGKNDGTYTESYKPNVGEYIWQYTSQGRVNGISGNVDLNMKYEGNSSNNNNENYVVTPIQKMVKIIAKHGVNVRKTPNSSIDTNKVTIYPCDKLVEVIGTVKNEAWYKDASGYYITAKDIYVTDAIGVVYNCNKLNVRSENNSKNPNNIISVITVGTEVKLLKHSNDWYYVKLPDGTKGWVSGKYINPS